MGTILNKALNLFLQSSLNDLKHDLRLWKILEKIQIVSIVTSIAIIIIATFMTDFYTIKLAVVSAVSFTIFLLLVLKKFRVLSATLTSFFLVGLVSYAVFTSGEGMHDEILLILPAFYFLGSLFLSEALFFFLLTTSLLSIFIIGDLQLKGIVMVADSNQVYWYDIALTITLLGGVALVMRQITKSLLKIMQSAIKAEQNYRNIFNTSNEAIFIHDVHTGKILDVNDSMLEMYKYSRDEILSLPIEQYDFASEKGESTSKNAVMLIKKAIDEGPQLFEWEAKRRDGSLFWVEISLNYSNDRVIAVVRNIDEKRRIESELTQRDKMRAVGQLAGGIAHDFNNQLSGIIGFAEVIKLESDSKNMKEYADHILSSAEASSHQIKQLLSFARKNKKEYSVIDINWILKQTISILEKSIDRKIKLQLDLNAKPIMINCDVSQMENAFLNIAINGRDAMADGGVLKVVSNTTEISDGYYETHGYHLKNGKYAQVLICDTGTGIEDNLQKKVFEPFFTTKASGEGTGMGLSAVYGTIKSHQGGINIQSTQSKGTTFQILLPLFEGKDISKNNQNDVNLNIEKAINGEGAVYIIDDEPSVRALAKKHIESLGFQPFLFEDGSTAIEKFKTEHKNVQFVLLDMIMPHISGEDVFNSLKDIRKDIKIIIISGFSLNQNAQSMLDRGAVAYLQKPYRRSELFDVIHKIHN